LLTSKKMLGLAILDGIFLTGVIFALLTKYVDLISYWWLIIVLGLPSLYYQYLRFKKSDELNSIKLIKLGVTVILLVIVILKV